MIINNATRWKPHNVLSGNRRRPSAIVYSNPCIFVSYGENYGKEDAY